MKDKGLWFAPAVDGDEGAYVGLHRALATFAQAVAPPERAEVATDKAPEK